METVAPEETAVQPSLPTPESVTTTTVVSGAFVATMPMTVTAEGAVQELAQPAAPEQHEAQVAEQQEGATGALRQSVAGWLGTAAIAFGSAFVLLGIFTMAVMLRRIRGRRT